MLKLIPQENPPAEKAKEVKKSGPKIHFEKFIRKEDQDSNIDQRTVKFTFVKLVDYFKKAEKYGIKEMGDLIHSLQRSVLSLQRKRNKLLRQQHHKKKK